MKETAGVESNSGSVDVYICCDIFSKAVSGLNAGHPYSEWIEYTSVIPGTHATLYICKKIRRCVRSVKNVGRMAVESKPPP